MSSPLITINADPSPTDAADLMLKNKVRHLLVVMTDSSQDKDKNDSMDDEYFLKLVAYSDGRLMESSKPLLPWNRMRILVMLMTAKIMLSRKF